MLAKIFAMIDKLEGPQLDAVLSWTFAIAKKRDGLKFHDMYLTAIRPARRHFELMISLPVMAPEDAKARLQYIVDHESLSSLLELMKDIPEVVPTCDLCGKEIDQCRDAVECGVGYVHKKCFKG